MYFWFILGGNIISDIFQFIVVVNEFGDYFLVVIDIDNCCSDMFMIIILEDQFFLVVSFGFDMVLFCLNFEIFLDGSGFFIGDEFVYEWRDVVGNFI